MHTLHASIICALIATVASGCPSGEDAASDYARQQAAKAAEGALDHVVNISATLPEGTHRDCSALFDTTQLTELLEEEEPVTVLDLTAKNPDSTSTCSIRRGGEPLDDKTQERKLEKTGRLGVMGGDELCNVTMYCSMPADTNALEERCRSEGSVGNHTLGLFACVKVTPKGERDGYAYRVIDADSKCTLQVRGGPGVVEESVVQSCVRASMHLITMDAVKPQG